MTANHLGRMLRTALPMNGANLCCRRLSVGIAFAWRVTMNEFEAAAKELADAMSELLEFEDFRRSTDPWPARDSMYRTPAAELRLQADAIEAKDAAILRAKKALQGYSAAVVKMPHFHER